MDPEQLQSWLSTFPVQTVWFYRTTNSNGEILLLILNYNGHELARKVFRPQQKDWDNTANPKLWLYPLPDDADALDVDPAVEFTFSIDMQDYEFPSGLVTNRAGRGSV